MLNLSQFYNKYSADNERLDEIRLKLDELTKRLCNHSCLLEEPELPEKESETSALNSLSKELEKADCILGDIFRQLAVIEDVLGSSLGVNNDQSENLFPSTKSETEA